MANTLRNVRYVLANNTGASIIDLGGSKRAIILSISVCNISSTVEYVHLSISENGGSNKRYFAYAHRVWQEANAAYGNVFYHDSRIVINPNEELWVESNTGPSSNLHVIVSYIDQDT